MELLPFRPVLRGERAMPTEALCDIGQAAQFNSDKMREVAELIASGYVERDKEGFKLTKKGENLLPIVAPA
jgi:predicted transcriptional regulator